MSSDDDAPEEVALSTGKEAFEHGKKAEQLHQKQVEHLVEEEAAVKKKKRQEVAEEQRKHHAAKKRRSEKDALKAKEDAEKLDLLPDSVVAAVLNRVGDQEREDQEPELEHGRVVEIGKSENITEIEKGPVSVRVLGMEQTTEPRERATGFREKLLHRHRRSAAMLRTKADRT
ncbi:hypothetical protein BSKO_11483 [Bryopsis sp. KO-2023]|nr:hypothetical protein BSKO_11483 [Bryopsis sp. KO-2023]